MMLTDNKMPPRQHKDQYRTLIECTFEAIVVHRDERLIYVNPAAIRMLGAQSAKDLIGKPLLDLVHPDFQQITLERMHSLATQDSAAPMMEKKFVRLDGSTIDVEVQSTPISYAGASAIQVTLRDITERKQAEQKLYLAASVFTHAREGIMITAMDGMILDVNEAFVQITGYSRAEVLGQNPRLLRSGRHSADYYAAMWQALREQGHWQGEIWNRRKNGEEFAALQTMSAVRDAQGNTLQYVALFSDITPLKAQQQQLEQVAHFDALTHLPNRILLADRLHQAMSQAQRRGQRLAVVFIDLDGFKTINDQHGHDAGDHLLIALSMSMKQALREGDTLARLGGDEFVAVLLEVADVATSVPMLERLLAAAAQPVAFAGAKLQLSASLGVTFFPQPEATEADQLLRQADQAMYQAKLAGKNRYQFFDAELDRTVRDHYESVERIRRALAEKEFVLLYQPKVNMRSGKVVGAETLIRWQHPQRGLLAPSVFLPVIENHPLAVEVGEWVLQSALDQMTLWQAQGLDIAVSVNVGARQLQEPDFAQRLHQLLAAHPQVKPSQLQLEVLETHSLQDMTAVSRALAACRDLGVSFALDDFGTGPSSLTYLKRLPVALLKIDQSFVHDMLDGPDDLAILESVIGLANAFRRQIIAEGVETAEHGAMLLQLGCELAQGYGIAHPMPAEEFPAWSAAWRTDPSWGNRPAVSRDDFALLYASVEHRAWIAGVDDYLKGRRDAAPVLDEQRCHFGLWLQGEGLRRHGGQPSFATAATVHRRTHELASQLCTLKAGGRSEAALAGVGQLFDLRNTLFEQLKVLV